jgi:hypothetical protein
MNRLLLILTAAALSLSACTPSGYMYDTGSFVPRASGNECAKPEVTAGLLEGLRKTPGHERSDFRDISTIQNRPFSGLSCHGTLVTADGVMVPGTVSMGQDTAGRPQAAWISDADQKTRDTKEAEQQIKQQAAQQKILSDLAARGYRTISFQDFELDGKRMANDQQKILIHGFYTKMSELELLFPDQAARIMASINYSTDGTIGLLTEDASRNLRRYLLQCRNHQVPGMSCSVTLLGRVSICTRSSLAGSVNRPCLIVEDGLNVPP